MTRERVILGIRKVKQDYAEYLISMQLNQWTVYASDDPAYRTSIARREVISKYNTGDEYVNEVDGIAEKIIEKFYSNTKDVLDPVSQNPEVV
ncbi:hypothetical protein J4D99_03680 [Siccationidurans ginsengisoli]|nr:hypothetical protein [Hymenobacter sp. BT559]